MPRSGGVCQGMCFMVQDKDKQMIARTAFAAALGVCALVQPAFNAPLSAETPGEANTDPLGKRPSLSCAQDREAAAPSSEDEQTAALHYAACLISEANEALKTQASSLEHANTMLVAALQMETQPSSPQPEPASDGLIEPIASDTISPATIGVSRRTPPSGAPDVVGSFRTFCMTSHFARVDPIVFPGRAEAGHLHRFMGNTLTDENSDYPSLRENGESSCYGGSTYRTAIWAPVLFDQDDLVVVPDYTGLYYKRYPEGSVKCTDLGEACVDLPVGLRIIYGTNYALGHNQSANVRFDCGGGPIAPTIAEATEACDPGGKLRASIRGPECWDGERTDSPDHQSHLAYPSRQKNTGQLRCPTTHPLVIPTVTYFEVTTLSAGDRPQEWRYSSDRMANTEGGKTFHGDYFEAIEPEIRERFHRNCIDGLLSCVDGELGDGTKLKRPAGFNFDAKPRLSMAEALAYRFEER